MFFTAALQYPLVAGMSFIRAHMSHTLRKG